MYDVVIYCGSNLFQCTPYHFRHFFSFQVCASGRYFCLIQPAFCMSECPCIQKFHLLWFHLMSHNISSLPILKLSSDLDEALHISQIASYKKKFDCFYLILVWTVTDWGVLTVFTGSDIWLYVAWTNFIVGITFYPRYTDISCKSAIS